MGIGACCIFSIVPGVRTCAARSLVLFDQEVISAASQARGEGQGCNLEVGRAAGEVMEAGCVVLADECRPRTRTALK